MIYKEDSSIMVTVVFEELQKTIAQKVIYNKVAWSSISTQSMSPVCEIHYAKPLHVSL